MLLPATYGEEGTVSATAGRCSPAAAGRGSPCTWTQQQPWLYAALPWSVFLLQEAPSTETVILSPPENKTNYQQHGNVSQDESSLRATSHTTGTTQTGAFR